MERKRRVRARYARGVDTPTSTRDEIAARLDAHRDHLRTMGVRRLDLFGSRARAEATPTSDVDLLVSFDRPVGLVRFLETKAYLEEILGAPVDLVTEGALHPAMRREILAEARRVA